jgi:hypothetical protein
MPFQVSPGVKIVERDLSTIIPTVATTPAGYVGLFNWGPANQRIVVSSENDLYQLYGAPDNDNFKHFFTVANFLQYGNNIQVVRFLDTTTADGNKAKNAVAGLSGYSTGVLIENQMVYDNTVSGSGYSVTANAYFAAKYAGTFGNSLTIEAVDTAAAFNAWGLSGQFVGAPSTSLFVQNVHGGSTASYNDEIHFAIIDTGGKFSGVTGTVLEIYDGLSKASDARKSDGSSNYYRNVINNSAYVYWLNHISGLGTYSSTDNSFGTIAAASSPANTAGYYKSGFTAGTLGQSISGITADNLGAAYADFFGDPDTVDVSILLGGPLTGSAAAQVSEVARDRMDCVAVISPDVDATIAGYNGSKATKDANAVAKALITRNAIGNNSYAIIDSGYKQMYDRYNDIYRYVPLNGDIAGLIVRTDETNDPWWSPAGFNRGNIRGVVQLAWNPDQTQRDLIYPKGINPVVTFSGEGTVLFGDRTAQTKPSAFDRINVRRLFIVLEKSIAIAAKYQLFEFNDAFTRANFVSMVEPFLRDVQARRGIYDFKVICDSTNNTPQVIDSNRFVADIYIKPARSINFIQLNFIATRTGVNFEEIASLSNPGAPQGLVL